MSSTKLDSQASFRSTMSYLCAARTRATLCFRKSGYFKFPYKKLRSARQDSRHMSFMRTVADCFSIKLWENMESKTGERAARIARWAPTQPVAEQIVTSVWRPSSSIRDRHRAIPTSARDCKYSSPVQIECGSSSEKFWKCPITNMQSFLKALESFCTTLVDFGLLWKEQDKLYVKSELIACRVVRSLLDSFRAN